MNFRKLQKPTMAAMLLFTASVLIGSSAAAQSFRLSAVSDMVRVFEDGYKLPQMYDSIKIFGIRGEIISGQVAIYTKKNLVDVTVNIDLFKDGVSGMTLPPEAVEWNFVGSIPLTANTPNQPPDVVSRPAPAMFPDYLISEKEITIKARSYRSIWLTVNIPENANEGIYNGKVTVKCKKKECTLPVSITVYPLSLPSERHLKVVEWHSVNGFDKFHGIKDVYSTEWFTMLGKYAENMASHRQNVFQVPMDVIEIKRSSDGNLEFDFKRFDQIANVFWDTKKMDILETGFLANFGDEAWFSTEIVLKDFTVIDSKTSNQIKMQGEEVVPYLVPAFERHLRQKGWLNKTLFHIRDEPSVHNALAWKEMSDYLHKYAPDLTRGDAIETTFILDDIEIACPKLDHFATWNETYKTWQERGNELWFYTVGIYQGSRFPDKTIDMPLIDSRLMHWLNYKYDAVGYLHWGYNQWDDDPFNKVGEHMGDAWLVYPAKSGVLNSTRWEQMRNGIQDYEYFWMLESKIKALKDSLGSRFSWIDPKQRGKEIAGEVISSFAEHTDDPNVLYSAKMKIIKELQEFNTSPELYVQTNPFAKSTLTNHSSVEVFGWTSPGTRIIINGAEIPVSKDGLFLEQFGGDFIDPSKIHLGDKITVQAIGAKGSKTIIREFIIR